MGKRESAVEGLGLKRRWKYQLYRNDKDGGYINAENKFIRLYVT